MRVVAARLRQADKVRHSGEAARAVVDEDSAVLESYCVIAHCGKGVYCTLVYMMSTELGTKRIIMSVHANVLKRRVSFKYFCGKL